MRTNNSRLLLLVVLISLIAVGFVSADEPEDCSWTADTVVDLVAGGGNPVMPYPESGENVGSVATSIEGDNLVVTFTTTGDWKLYETHLYVGSEAPSNSAPGQLGYQQEHPEGVTTYTYSIPLSTFGIVNPCCEDCEETLYVAAHADVKKVTDGVIQQEETAWGWGDNPFGTSWARYITVLLTCVCDGNGGTQEEECFNETVWAATAPGVGRFVDQGNWATFVTYTLGSGSADAPRTYTLYAGQDIPAGTLEVYDDGSMLFVNYVEGSSYMDCIGGWTLTESHLQIAEDGVFSGVINRGGNPVPGRFQYTAEDGLNGIPITKTTGDIQIAAHGVMEWCGVCPN